ncbi:MAG: hypothetical protein NCW75_07435 [Phycisphaera sp.]|nr:MAG: hypothetical protein NCW75_07435 [Phycisphaera sp.]
MLGRIAGLTVCAAAASSIADPLTGLRVLEGGDYFIVDDGMREGAPAFDSQSGDWTRVPGYLMGGDYIRTDADDKDDDDIELVATVRGPATIYVLHTDQASVPGWLLADYVDTGDNLVLDEGDDDWTYSIYRMDLMTSGETSVSFFENTTGDLDDDLMYGVVAVAAAAPCRPDIDGDGELTLFDFLAFQNLFDTRSPEADFDGDGELTLFDFLAFQNAFDAGC